MNPKISTRENEMLYFIMKPWLIKIEEMLELENHQWMLNLTNDSLIKNRAFT